MTVMMAQVLSSTYIIPAAAALLLLYLVVATFTAWYRLRHIKGPFLATFSYLWLIRNTLKGRQGEGFRSVSDTYGTLARVGPNDLLTSDPEIIRRMGRTNTKPTYGRSVSYTTMKMDPYHDAMISERDTRAHDRLKAKLSFGYGGRENPTLEEGIDAQIDSLVRLIRRKYISAAGQLKPMDLAVKVQYFTLDALTRIAYGYAFGFLDTDSDVYEYIKGTDAVLAGIGLSSEVPWIARILQSPLLLRFMGPKPTDEKGFGKLVGLAAELARSRHAPGAEDKKDMLGSFIRHGLGERDCQAEILFQIVAGSDTTATALRGTLTSLMTAPLAYRKLQEEIDAAVASGSISTPIRSDEGRKLPYLQAVIYEGLRINFPFTGLASKEVPRKATPSTRSKDVFGDDADGFRPERWLGIDDATLKLRRNQVELIFGSGRWGCSGKPIAFMELNKVYVELLRRFDMQLVYPTRPVDTVNVNLVLQKGLWVMVTERFPETCP